MSTSTDVETPEDNGGADDDGGGVGDGNVLWPNRNYFLIACTFVTTHIFVPTNTDVETVEDDGGGAGDDGGSVYFINILIMCSLDVFRSIVRDSTR